MPKHSWKETWNTRLLAEVEVSVADAGGFDLDQDFIVSQVLVDTDELELERSSWLRNNEGVGEHSDSGDEIGMMWL